jgi:RNAse (barnase) inhibitor barstar
MSGLAALLGRRKPAGVYHWSSPMRTHDIRHAAEHAGWRCVVLDTTTVADAAGFHGAVAAAFEPPEGYGDSLEALADLLAAVSEPGDPPTLVVWESWAGLAEDDPSTARGVVEAFAHRCRDEPTVAVVLHGPGPDLELVELDRRPTLPR